MEIYENFKENYKKECSINKEEFDCPLKSNKLNELLNEINEFLE